MYKTAIFAPAVFQRDEERFVPTPLAAGPWDPGAQHGGAPSALLVHALERQGPAPDDGMVLARLTFEFPRPVPLDPLDIRIDAVRRGRRVRVDEARLLAAGREVCRATAMWVDAVPQQAELAAPRDAAPVPGPPSGPPERRIEQATGDQVRFLDAVDLVFVEGDWGPGPGTVWVRLRTPVVDGEPVTPGARVAAAADFGNGIAPPSPFQRYLYPNIDMAIYLARPPAGEWVGLRSQTLAAPGGASFTESELLDERGRIGRAVQSLWLGER